MWYFDFTVCYHYFCVYQISFISLYTYTVHVILLLLLYYTIGAVPLNSLTQSSSFPIHYNNLNCVGNETNVYDCPELNTTMCTTNNAAIVACQYG